MDQSALLDVPSELWHAWDFCLAAVQLHDWALEFVPEALKTPELCLAAVQQVRERDEEHGGGDELADQLLTDELPSEHQDEIRKKLNL